MVICIKRICFMQIVNYHFKTREMKNVEKLVEQTVQAFKSLLLDWIGNMHFCTICEITFLVHVGGP